MAPSILTRLSAVRATPRPRPVAVAVLVIAVGLALDVAIFLDPFDLLAAAFDSPVGVAAIAVEAAVTTLAIYPVVGFGFDLVRAAAWFVPPGAVRCGEGGVGIGIWEYHVLGSEHGSGGDDGGDGGGGGGD